MSEFKDVNAEAIALDVETDNFRLEIRVKSWNKRNNGIDMNARFETLLYKLLLEQDIQVSEITNKERCV